MSEALQLDIFSWQSEKFQAAWQALSAFDFTGAKNNLAEITESDPENEELDPATNTLIFWQNVFLQLRSLPASEGPLFLLNNIDRYIFNQTWGEELLKKALLTETIKRAENAELFFVDPCVTLSDLYLRLNDRQGAESTILKQLVHEYNTSLIIELANIQWHMGKLSEARSNYLKVILQSPEKIDPQKIENTLLKKAMINHGVTFAAAWAWLYGEQLPLINAHEFIGADNNPNAARACILLLKAEKARKENSSEKIIYRKQLYEIAPELYKAYFRWIESGVIPLH